MKFNRFAAAFGVAIFVNACISEDYGDKFRCPATPVQELTPVIAPAAGAHPVWMVDGSYGLWPGRELPVKTVWIIARDTSGDLEVTARQLDGDGTASFHVPGKRPIEKLSIPNADHMQMLPGGADQATIDKYSFRSSAIYYSNPGCWEFRIGYNGTMSSVVVDIT